MQTTVYLEVKYQQEVINLRWKLANGKKRHYGDTHCDHLTFLLLESFDFFLCALQTPSFSTNAAQFRNKTWP